MLEDQLYNENKGLEFSDCIQSADFLQIIDSMEIIFDKNLEQNKKDHEQKLKDDEKKEKDHLQPLKRSMAMKKSVST